MVKLWGKSFVKFLIIIFQNFVTSSHYQDFKKKSNVICVHKEHNKQLIQNYRLISLLPYFVKYLKKIIFNKIYNFLLNERLLNSN